ncbi:MAG: hypothetical protein ABIJ81_03730 [Patescibacteria group bacterium]
MEKYETVLVSASVDQVKDVVATLCQAIPKGMTSSDAQSISGKKGKFIADIRQVFAKYSTASVLASVLLEWQDLWKEFGVSLDLSELVIPECQEGFDRLLVIPQGIGAERVFQRCKSTFGAWKYTDCGLDEVVPTNDRTNIKTYEVWIRDRVEADKELKNMSANTLAQAKILGVTLLERLVYEWKYFKESGKHLDIQKITLCSGSRDADGNVPCVYWLGGKLRVHWAPPGYQFDSLRSRAAVSL